MPGKYDRLGAHLAAQDKTAGRIVMSRAEIERLADSLPARASTDAWWLEPAPTSAQARAWLAAGWEPQSVSPDGTVVFVPRLAALSEQLPAPGSEKPASASSVNAGQKTTWRSQAADLKGWAVAAISAGVATAVWFEHLPWYATTMFSVGVAVVAFAATQAFSARGNAEQARRWWAATATMLLLIGVIFFAYHKWLDPATRAGVPFTVTVDPDPTSLVSSQGCRQIILPGPWRNPAPPASLLQEVVNPWEQSQHGVDAALTYVAIFLQGTSDQAVQISSPEVIVAHRGAPLRGPAVQLGGGCGSVQDVRVFNVNLDQQYPVAVFENGKAFPDVKRTNGIAREAPSPVFKITASDPEYFVIAASAHSRDVKWHIDITWASAGRRSTYQIDDGSAPFETSAYNPSVNPTYSLLSNGTWSRIR